jgi:hypothetical protein
VRAAISEWLARHRNFSLVCAPGSMKMPHVEVRWLGFWQQSLSAPRQDVMAEKPIAELAPRPRFVIGANPEIVVSALTRTIPGQEAGQADRSRLSPLTVRPHETLLIASGAEVPGGRG